MDVRLTTVQHSPRGCATIWLATLLLTFCGCAVTQPGSRRCCVDAELRSRTFHQISATSSPGSIELPPGVLLEDGLTEEEAVATALWNNRDFNATLANLGMARGDLLQAGLLTNPQFNFLFPAIGTKQLEWTLFVPLEAMILRQRRVDIAERDYRRIAEELIQNGLNVTRDTRLAYADFVFASQRHDMALEAVEVREGIARLAEKRLTVGDISELEATATRADATRSRAQAIEFRYAVDVADAALKNLMGIARLDTPLTPMAAELPPAMDFDIDALMTEAVRSRPDLKAACYAVDAAVRRAEVAQWAWLRVDAVADGNSGGAGPTNVGPGLRFDIPIFNRNEGGVLRSQWTVDQANHNYHAVYDRIITEVRTAVASVRQARFSLDILQGELLETLTESRRYSEKAYEDGGADYFLVLQTTSQFLDARIRELELSASLRKAHAELDRSVGRRVIPPQVVDVPPLPSDELSTNDAPMDAAERPSRQPADDSAEN